MTQELSALTFEPLKHSRGTYCSNKCWQYSGKQGTKSGRWKVYIAGWYVGLICNTCKQDWERWWVNAYEGVGTSEEDRGRDQG